MHIVRWGCGGDSAYTNWTHHSNSVFAPGQGGEHSMLRHPRLLVVPQKSFQISFESEISLRSRPPKKSCEAVELWLLAWPDLSWQPHVEKQRCAGICVSALPSSASHRARP